MGGFFKQATEGRTLAALIVGGLAYRFGRIGAMTTAAGNAAPILSLGAGLGTEVAAFEMTNRLLASPGMTGRGLANLWRWDGSGGIRQGLLGSLITFGALKGAGRLAAGENILVQHLVQDTAMVFGQNIAGALHVAPKPTGSMAEQYFGAEAFNLQLKAGTALGYTLTGGRLFALEKGLESSLRSDGLPENSPRASLGSRILFPLKPALAAADREPGPRPMEIFAMVKREGDEGVRPPSSPKDVNPTELKEIHEGLWRRFYTAEDDFSRHEKRMQRYLTIFFSRYAALVTRWGYGDRDRPLEISNVERKQLERPLTQISSLVTAFAVSQREMERIQFDFRRWGIDVTPPVQKTYALFRDTYKRFFEVADTTEKNLLPVIDKPCLTLAQYSQLRRILGDLEEKNFDWLVPTLPHTSFLPENKSGSPEGDLVSSIQKVIPMGDLSKDIGEAFEPTSQRSSIQQFLTHWAAGMGAVMKPAEWVRVEQKLARDFPPYFTQQLSYYASIKPLLAKVLIVKFQLIGKNSPLNLDPEVQAELGKKSREAYPPSDFEEISNSVISHYEWAAVGFFPKQFKPLNTKEREEWERKIGDLPPLILETLNEGGIRAAPFLLLAHKFGLPAIGIPVSTEVPETP